MHAPIRHRGPDGEGFLVVEPDGPRRLESLDGSGTGPALAGLAFRRLKILDLSEAAAQPMGSPDGSLWIVFNGEIYNFRELRAELEGGGRHFATAGDTEVALAAFEAWGENAFERLEGMWAIVILDLARRRLVASRDRFGIKPLYFRREGGRLLLASEIKQILAAGSKRPCARAPVVAKFLSGNRYPILDETFFDEIFPVPPATWFESGLDAPAGAPPTSLTLNDPSSGVWTMRRAILASRPRQVAAVGPAQGSRTSSFSASRSVAVG